MVKDNHRKYDLMRCYACGYMEGRNMGGDVHSKFVTNQERLNGMNFNEAVFFHPHKDCVVICLAVTVPISISKFMGRQT